MKAEIYLSIWNKDFQNEPVTRVAQLTAVPLWINKICFQVEFGKAARQDAWHNLPEKPFWRRYVHQRNSSLEINNLRERTVLDLPQRENSL